MLSYSLMLFGISWITLLLRKEPWRICVEIIGSLICIKGPNQVKAQEILLNTHQCIPTVDSPSIAFSVFGLLFIINLQNNMSHNKNNRPCSREHESYPWATWTSIEDDHITRPPCHYPYHETKEFSLSIQDEGRAHKANWASVCAVQIRLVAGIISQGFQTDTPHWLLLIADSIVNKMLMNTFQWNFIWRKK